MLAQSFKSAADLKITEPQLSALQKTLVLLETGKVEHVPSYKITSDMPKDQRKFSGLFNMKMWAGADDDCGTVCCIGGTAELIGNIKFGTGFGMGLPTAELSTLFYPPFFHEKWESITPSQAARALRSYLTTGDPMWGEAVR